MSEWVKKHAIPNLSDPTRYGNGVVHWQNFFAEERRAGRLTGPPTVADIDSDLVRRFHAWRRRQGVGGHTIARDTAALRQPLNWAWMRRGDQDENAPSNRMRIGRGCGGAGRSPEPT